MWLLLGLALAGAPVVLPASEREVVFDDDVGAVVEAALAELSARRFDDASRQLAALADAGGNVDVRYLEALARYEAGDLRLAERAAEQGVEGDARHAPLLSLQGLILADLGRGDQGLGVLDRAEAAAGDDAAVKARVQLNRGRIYMDRGEPVRAGELLKDALARAEALGDAGLADIARANLATLDGEGGDVIGEVAQALRAGDTGQAREVARRAPDQDRRGRVQGKLAEALIARHEGRLDAAVVALRQALPDAREGGLVRETAAVLVELGTAYALGGRFEVARDNLEEAVGLVSGTSFRVAEASYRAEAGRSSARLGDLGAAKKHLAAGRRAGGKEAVATARLDELEGMIAAAEDRVDAADAALTRALNHWDKAGYAADAARVATDRVELFAGRDAKRTDTAAKRAEALFARLGHQVGPAHVQIALGLGLARRGKTAEALEAFAKAGELAEAAGGERGKQVARIARENAARALRALGHSDDAATHARQHGLGEVIERQAAFEAAESAYHQGLEAYQSGDVLTARDAFGKAWKGFTDLGEEGYATTARRARGWATYNGAVLLKPAEARPLFAEVVREGKAVGDVELEARAMAALALARVELGDGDVLDPLLHAAARAEMAGLLDVAARCWGAVAEQEVELAVRIDAARKAYELAPEDDPSGVYALYSVSVAAYNAGNYEAAHALAQEALPRAGELESAVRGVVEAAAAEL